MASPHPVHDAPPPTVAGLPRTLFPVAALTVFDSSTFFGLQSLLVFYIYFATDEGGLGFSMESAIAVSAALGAATYLGTIVMGWYADRVTGAARMLRTGPWIAAAGYLLLAFVPGAIGLGLGLVTVMFGAAAMWIGESATVGGTLDRFPGKRDAGFTVYYIGGALGAFVGVALAGVLQNTVGFTVGFVVSAVALVIGRLLYGRFRRGPEQTAPRVAPEAAATPRQVLGVTLLVLSCVIALAVAVALGLNPATLLGIGALLIAAVFFIQILGRRTVAPAVKHRVVEYLPFFVATIVFNGLYQQLYSTVAVHSDTSTDRMLLGMEIPPSSVLAAAPLCSIFLAPLLAALWGKLGERGPSLAAKFSAAFVLSAGALMLLALTASAEARTPLLVVATTVFALGAADVVLTPSGLALASEVGPPEFTTRMIAIQYLAIAGGIALAGTTGAWFLPGENEGLYFGICAAIGFAVAAGMAVTAVRARRRAQRTRAPQETLAG